VQPLKKALCNIPCVPVYQRQYPEAREQHEQAFYEFHKGYSAQRLKLARMPGGRYSRLVQWFPQAPIRR